MNKTFRLNLEELVHFYDETPDDSHKLATPINALIGEEVALGLLKHYAEEERGWAFKLIDRVCTPGTKAGGRLDAWIEIKDGDSVHHYQTEIKNWNAHSFGGVAISKAASEMVLSEYRKNEWCRYYGYFSNKDKIGKYNCSKVLNKMSCLPEHEGVPKRPLLCPLGRHTSRRERRSFFQI